MDNEVYELIILGAGPAGTAAGVYAKRKNIKTLMITDGFGGQAVVASKIENIIGHPARTGTDLAMAFERHLKAVGMEIIMDRAMKVETDASGFKISTSNGDAFLTKNILVALGSRHRHLNVSGEDKFQGRGIAYCSTCDAPMFKDKIVVVVGGGNSALNSVMDLLPYASKIHLLAYTEQLVADLILREKIEKESKVGIILNAKVSEIKGESDVSGIKYQDLKTNEQKELTADGVFIHIGMSPNTDIFKGLLELNKGGEIIAEPITGKTSVLGIWAAGDITNLPYKQINVAMGDAIRAVLDIYESFRLEK